MGERINRYYRGWRPEPMETPIKEKNRRERGNENRVKEERVKDGASRVTGSPRTTPGTDDAVSGASPPQ
jgi:hypothetical protein